MNYNDYSIESNYHQAQMKEQMRAAANQRSLDRSVDGTTRISKRALGSLVNWLTGNGKVHKSKLATNS
jgi:hypothetical protein